MSVKKYLTLSGLTYFLNKIKTYLTSSTYLDSIGISNSDIDDIADDAGYSSGSLPASEDIFITGDIIPNTDNSVDLGASSKNIKMVYTKGITINGTQFLPSDYVNLTTAQTIGGAKTFYTSATAYPIIKLKTAFIEQGLYDSDSLRGVAFRCADKNDAILGDFGYKTERTGEVGSYFSARTKVNNTQTTREVKLRFKPGSTDCELVPDTTNLIDLGTSTYKWKSVNGIAPDELGLPTSTYTDVSSYITNFDSTPNMFTAPVSGLLFIEGNAGVSVNGALFDTTKSYHVNCPWVYNNVRGFIPVEKGDSIECYLSAPINLSYFRIYHLKGKV